MSVESLIFFYNKTLLENSGLEVATTFEEVIEQAKSYNVAEEGKFLLRFEPGNTYTSYMLLTAAGFELFGPNGDDPSLVNLGSDEVIKGLTYLTQINDVLEIPSADLSWDTVHGEFVKGNVGNMVGGRWQFEEIMTASEELGFEWGVGMLPTIDGAQPKPFLGNITATISAYTEHPDLVREILAFISSTEGLQLMYDTEQKLPALTNLDSIKGVNEDFKMVALSQQTASSIAMPMLKELLTVYEVADVMVQSVWDGLATPEEAAAKAETDFNNLIEMTK